MKNRNPVNIFNGAKFKEIKIDSSNLISIKYYQNSQNITKPFIKPISKIF